MKILRMITYEGTLEWIERTLEFSFPIGKTEIGENSITITPHKFVEAEKEKTDDEGNDRPCEGDIGEPAKDICPLNIHQ